VFVQEHYFYRNRFAIVCEVFGDVCLHKEAPSKTTLHRLVIKFWDTKAFACSKASNS
jgi:hypothetical protein